jgi:F-box/leucine-rich repeat protein 13
MITDMSIQYISGVCAYLQVLDLSSCHLITDKSLKFLQKGCKRMRRLAIVDCINISKDAIDRLNRKVAEIDHIANHGTEDGDGSVLKAR